MDSGGFEMKNTMERTIKVSDLEAVIEVIYKDATICEQISDEYAIEARNSDNEKDKNWNSTLEYHNYGRACGLREAVRTIADMLGIGYREGDDENDMDKD